MSKRALLALARLHMHVLAAGGMDGMHRYIYACATGARTVCGLLLPPAGADLLPQVGICMRWCFGPALRKNRERAAPNE